MIHINKSGDHITLEDQDGEFTFQTDPFDDSILCIVAREFYDDKCSNVIRLSKPAVDALVSWLKEWNV